MKSKKTKAIRLLFGGLLLGAIVMLPACGAGDETGDGNGDSGDGDALGVGGTSGLPGSGGQTGLPGAGGSASGGSGPGAGGNFSTGGTGAGVGGTSGGDCTDTGADATFSFFMTSYHHIQELSGSPNGFGGDLRYGGASTGLAGADAICQEIASRVCFGHKTWRAFLSTSSEDAIDRIGAGPWYDHAGSLVANDLAHLISEERPAGGCCDTGTLDELGNIHDGEADYNNDGEGDDDHDVLTASNEDGQYDGFSCDDWTSTTADGSPRIGHAWPAQSGQHFIEAHTAPGCGAGVNFEQGFPGPGGETVGANGGYGALYCFALAP